MRARVSAAVPSRAISLARAAVRGDTAASQSTSTRQREVRAQSQRVSRAKNSPPSTPPARAGLATYRDCIVSAEADRYTVSPARGDRTVRAAASQVSRPRSSRASSRTERIQTFMPRPPRR